MDAGDIGHGAGDYGDNDAPAARRHGRRTDGVHSEEKSVAVHVESHGALDTKRLFIRLAAGQALVLIDKYRPNLVAEDSVKSKLLDADAWSPPDNEKVLASGHYPGATGWTRLWREFWQIGQRQCAWKFWQPLEPRFSQRTWLEVSCVTWCYNEAGDFQTDIVIDVKVLPVWDRERGIWVFDGEPFDRHKNAAEKLAAKLRERIAASPAPAHAKRVRENARAQAVPPAPTGVPTDHAPIPPAPAPAPGPTSRLPKSPADAQGAHPKPVAVAAVVPDTQAPVATPRAASGPPTDNRAAASGADLSVLLGG